MKGSFKYSDILLNYNNLVNKIPGRPTPSPGVEKLYVGSKAPSIGSMSLDLTSLEKPSRYDHLLKDSKVLFFIPLLPRNTKSLTGDFEFDLTWGGDFIIPVLFMNEKLDRWIAGVAQEDLMKLLSRKNLLASSINYNIQLVYAGGVCLSGLGAGENIINDPFYVRHQLMNSDNIEIYTPDPTRISEENVEHGVSLLKALTQHTFSTMFTSYDQVEFKGPTTWPIPPLRHHLEGESKINFYKYLNACGEADLKDAYHPISLNEMETPVGREGMSPRLKWKKLGI